MCQVYVFGKLSPIKYPQGSKYSILSKITFRIAITGMAKNIPEIQATAPPIIIPIIEKNAFISTFEFTTIGKIVLLSIS